MMIEDINESETHLSSIECLPTALLHHEIFDYLSDKDLCDLSKRSRAMWFLCQAPLQERKNRAAKKLLSHVVKGEEEQALKMIHAYPKFLLLTSIATDYSNRLYNNYTPFQAALLCHDVTLWEKIEPYFDKLENGQIEKANQFNALFPAGIPQGIPYDFNVLIQIITNSSDTDIVEVLQKRQNDTAICLAMNQFRNNFNTLAMHEKFFNPTHLMKALKVYEEQFDTWSWNQRYLFWRQVIGYIQRFVPANLAQAFIQGLYYIVNENQPLSRSLKFKYDDGFYFPVEASVGSGFDYGICALRMGPVRVGGSRTYWNSLRSYVEKILRSYSNLSTSCTLLENPLGTMTA